MKIYILKPDLILLPIEGRSEGRHITLFIREIKDNRKHNFRCPECGKLLFKYTGDLISIFDGAARIIEKSEIDAKCYRCKLTVRVISV